MQKLAPALLFMSMFFFSSHTGLNRPAPQPVKKYNVLFIFVDDLRPELGCYGNSVIKTPNIDKLASEGTLFKKQYVTVPTCGASRRSLLTGMRPRSATDLSNDVLEIRKKENITSEGPESFVAHFRNNGYYTVGMGKISHSPDGYIYKYLEPKGKERELPDSWDEMLFDPGKWGTGWNAFFGYADGSNRNELKGAVKPYEGADVDDENYPDGLTSRLAIQKLRELAKNDKPFFLGIGFFKPHLPFNAPKKYWDMYDEADMPLTPSPDIPMNVNKISLQESGEFNAYRQGEEKASLAKPVSDAYARKLRRAYYASVSYVDAQIGKVLDELKKANLDKNTIVVLWGDHGWHLGDNRVWGKHTLAEWSVRSPLIVKAPGTQKAVSSDKIISSIDVYPSLMELCGIRMPYKTDGKSFVPLLKKSADTKWSNVAYSYYKSGISVRTDRYRLSKYFRSEQPVTELYDHQSDPYENKNIANENPALLKSLEGIWRKGDTGLYEL